MTLMTNLENDRDRWDAMDGIGFERILPNRDGQMPVGRDRSKHRSHRRATPHLRRGSRSAGARR